MLLLLPLSAERTLKSAALNYISVLFRRFRVEVLEMWLAIMVHLESNLLSCSGPLI